MTPDDGGADGGADAVGAAAGGGGGGAEIVSVALREEGGSLLVRLEAPPEEQVRLAVQNDSGAPLWIRQVTSRYMMTSL